MQNPNNPNQKNQMHPDDIRNMLIFFVVAAILYVGYSTFVLEPQNEAMRAAEAQKQEQIANGTLPQAPETQKIVSREEALQDATARRIEIDNGVIFGSLSTKGARLDDIALHNYHDTLENKKNVVLLSPQNTDFPRYFEYGWVSSDKSLNLPDKETIWRVRGNKKLTKENPITLVWDNGAGLIFERTYAIDDTFMLTVSQNVTNNTGRSVTLYPYGLVSQKGIPPGFTGRWMAHEGPVTVAGEELHEPSYKDLRKGKTESRKAEQGWLGITEKYWLTVMIPPRGEESKYSFNYRGTEKDKENQGRYQADYLGAAVQLGNGQSHATESQLFVGAKRVLTLQDSQEKLDIPHFDRAVDFGWLWFLSKPFFYMLHYIGEFVGNFGVAIILLTILIRGSVFPLTNLSYRSFAKMKKVSPQIMELREKYSDDKQKLQQELVKMYQKEGVNPMAGCFPILLQIPIFFALYKVLFVTIEMRHAPFFGWIKDLSAPDPTSIFNLFGLIPWDPPAVLMIGVWPCIMLVAMLIQKNLNPPPQDKLQKDIATWMPFMFAFIMSKFAAGLVVYWSFSAIIGIIQQIIIMKSLNVPIHLFGETKEEKELDEAVEKGPAVHPLSEMAEDEVEDALFGHEEEEAEEKPKKVSPPKPKKSKKKK